MRRGDFETAWRLSDAALRLGAFRDPSLPRHLQAIWDGRPPDGRRVLVRCYHGLGDTLQFLRYVPLLQSVASKVVLWVQPELLDLCRMLIRPPELEPLSDGAPLSPYDVDVEIMELPHVFRTTLSTIPRDVPYLHVRPVPLRRDGKLAVGVFWRPGGWDERRAVPFRQLARLSEVRGVTLHVLQRGPALAERPRDWGVVSGRESLLVLAKTIKALDLVITPDAMPAHLAGALGVPVWTLLHDDPDWRWMVGRSDSPWYPSMRLFRQRAPGDWDGVIGDVLAALDAEVRLRHVDVAAS